MPGLLVALLWAVSPVHASNLQTQDSPLNTGTKAARLTVGTCTTGDALVPDGVLAGDPGVEPCGKLVANNVDIAPGSTSYFRAGTSVELGDGFSVATGARLSVALGSTPAGNAFVRDDSPAAATDYYARFYINPDNLVLDSDIDQFEHLVAYDASGNREFLVGVTYESSATQTRLFATAFEDGGASRTTKDACEPVLGPGWQYVEVHYTASTGTDGDLEFSANGGAPVSLAQCLALAGGLDNDTGEISAVEWGALNASPGYLGAMGLDDFDSRASALLTSNPDRLQPASSVNNNQTIEFGSAVALDGNIMVVGSPGEDLSPSVTQTGAVRVFERQGGTWVETDKLTAPTETSQERFGNSVDVALGDDGTGHIIVGGRGFNATRGRAHFFKRSNGGPWLHEQTVTQLVPGNGYAFGEDVAIDFFQPPNDPGVTGPVFVAAVGSPFSRDGAFGSQNGSVSVFQRSGSPANWGQTHEFFGAGNELLGSSVAMAGPDIVAAADGLVNPGKNGGGARSYRQANLDTSTYVYSAEGSLLPSDYDPGAALGKGLVVALDNDPGSPGIAVLGAQRHDTTTLPTPDDNTGKVYIFELGPSPTEVATILAPGLPNGAGFGTSVALSGPILAVGAPGVGQDGTVFLYEKGASNATWSPVGQLTVPDVPPSGACRGGYDAALQGALAAVGCSAIGGDPDNEAVFMYFGDAIFSDGFESGDTSAWTSSTP